MERQRDYDDSLIGVYMEMIVSYLFNLKKGSRNRFICFCLFDDLLRVDKEKLKIKKYMDRKAKAASYYRRYVSLSVM